MLKENIEMIQAMRKVVMNYFEKGDYLNEDIISAAKFILMYDLIEEEYKNKMSMSDVAEELKKLNTQPKMY